MIEEVQFDLFEIENRESKNSFVNRKSENRKSP
jgi:hypothetical protein